MPDRRALTRECDNVSFKRQIRNCETKIAADSLVDGGTTGRLTGGDVRCFEMTLAEADAAGVTDDDLKDLGIGTFAATFETADGRIVGLFSQHAD